MMDPEKLFNDLESNNLQEYEETKNKLADYFNLTRDQWVVQGMMDYYLRTNSVRIVDVLVKVQPPHDKYVFDRLSDWIRGHNNRTPALSLFSFIVRKNPTWLCKVEKHALIKDILKIMQTEKNIIPLMSALICIITLLPIIPSLVPSFLQDLFEVFGHLASWKSTAHTECQLIHLQIGLYMLFHRLYGMYPCNFMHYLRQEFSVREKGAIFQHTIKPLLQSVRIHPMLITSTRDKEVDKLRWKEMGPHDVVVECAKLTLDYYQENSDCFLNISALRSQNSLTSDAPISEQIKEYTHNTPFQFATSRRDKQIDYQKFDSIWSPSIEIMATPPPTVGGTVPHTPTPSYGVPTVATSSTLDASGASPPEAAVEATPETTPLKDVTHKRVMASSSHSVRAILTSSQPSSPMRKEQTPFHFPETASQIYKSGMAEQTNKTAQRLKQMVNDRKQSQAHIISGRSSSNEETGVSISASTFTVEEIRVRSEETYSRFPPTDSSISMSESAKEDQEVTHLTSQKTGDSFSDTLQDISPDSEDCDDNERSPCSTGGLHFPDCRLFARRNKQNRMASYCLNYGMSTVNSNNVEQLDFVMSKSKVRRTKSWPILHCYQFLEENGIAIALSSNVTTNRNDNIATSGTMSNKKEQVQRITCGTQTLEYESNLLELLGEESKARNIQGSNILKPSAILDQYIEKTVKMESTDARNGEDVLREQIKLLHLQLQYERYRREVHAERNRRLLGRSRTNRSLEMNNERLNDQVTKLHDEIRTLKESHRKASSEADEREQELSSSSNSWKTKYNIELEDNKQLKSKIDNLQRRLNDEIKNRKEITAKFETLQGELFDMKNDMQHAQLQAELGNQYRQQLNKLQSEVSLMGEIQIKCRDKIAEIDNLKARDVELEQLQEAYNKEVRELQHARDIKTAQIENGKARLAELQSQLSSRDAMFTDQKRLLKATKEEYQERFDALDKKYENQKAIIMQMEEHIETLLKNQKAVNLESEKSEKTDAASSIDINSPLSHSLASSEGLSASLRSVTEFRNLQDLVVQPNSAGGDIATVTERVIMEESSSSVNQQNPSVINKQVTSSATVSGTSGGRQKAPSLDIPVPGPSQHHSHRRHYPRN